jgi:ferritin-like metal-binding protein YciE
LVNESRELFVHMLCELYDAERRFALGLQEMIRHATDVRLQGALNEQAGRTERYLGLLEQVFRDVLGREPERELSEQARGLLLGAQTNVEGARLGAIRDYMINDALLKIEGFEAAAFNSLRLIAERSGHAAAVPILEESGADDRRDTAGESLRHLAGKIHQSEHPGFIQRLTGQDFTGSGRS